MRRAASPATAQAPTLPEAPVACPIAPRHHAWARFEPGAWRRLRVTTETFDPAGVRIGRSETIRREVLKAVTERDYTLEADVTVQIGGKHLHTPAKVVTYRTLTDTLDAPQEVTQLPDATLLVGDQTVNCQRWKAAFGQGAQSRMETVFYSPSVAPYILKRETVAADSSDPTAVSNETLELVALDAPVEIDGEFVRGSRVLHRTTAGAIRSEGFELHTMEVPGGLVEASTTHRDASGQRIRWTVTRLEDFGQSAGSRAPEPGRWGLFRRHKR